MCNNCNNDVDKYRLIAEQAEREKNRYFVIIITLIVALIISLIYIVYRTFQDSQYDYVEYTQESQTGDNYLNVNINKDGATDVKTNSENENQRGN